MDAGVHGRCYQGLSFLNGAGDAGTGPWVCDQLEVISLEPRGAGLKLGFLSGAGTRWGMLAIPVYPRPGVRELGPCGG